jgi:hypothetical protein
MKWKMVLAAGVFVAASAGIALLNTNALAQSANCARDDVPCRLDRIEARLQNIERRIGSGGGGDGVSVAANARCYLGDCPQAAQTVCRNAGMDRGVPDQIETRDDRMFVTRATCFPRAN